ncbi:unnamed protein product [Brassica rapa]|uniref:F-box domain-containing protein n=1 Tax=Brassica campestris TaxID=3711 RepID=A0A3P5ZGA5_BRACM|nr:unnamed protein product [Brassica rapa]VDC71790.1 unnamed protein product [Brassica rapa]
MMMSDLPPELIEEILSRVPASSLKPLRSSCKRWNTLFKDPRFAEKHFAKAQRNSHVIILKELMFCPMMNVHLKVVLPSVEFKELGLEDFHSNKPQQVCISDCFHCDGFLLCITTDDRLVVWNPCVGETRWIQYNNSYGGHSRFVLGYEKNKSGHTYKIMRYYWKHTETNGTVVEVYEFGSGSWRVLDDVNLGTT